MDLITGLSTIGSYISGKENNPNSPPNTHSIRRQPINGDNIYNSKKSRQDKRYMSKIAEGRYKQALCNNTDLTGIVPNLYNTRQGLRKSRSMDSITNDHMAFFKNSNLLQDNKIHTKKILKQDPKNNEPTYFAQFEDLSFNNPSMPVSSNNTPKNTNSMQRMEMERSLALQGNYSDFDGCGAMTYGIVPEDQLTHNNMTPFFKKGYGKGYGPDSIEQAQLTNTFQRKTEMFTGSVNNPQYRPKTERRPLFNPHVGLTWIYGMPNFTDYMESRFIPSRERRNEKIHQEVKVTPGLNLGYNEVSKQGYHDTYRVLPPTVDDLRVASNPKVSYGQPVITGMKGSRRPILSNVAKRRPTTFRELDPRDMVKGRSYYTGQTIYGNIDMPSTNRQMTSKAWASAAQYQTTLPTPEGLMPKVKISHKENFKSDAAGHNVTGVERSKSTTNTANTYHAPLTNRTLTQNKTWINPAGPSVVNKNYVIDYKNAIPDNTMRDLAGKNTYLAPAGTGQTNLGGYGIEASGIHLDPTMRQLTQNTTQINGVYNSQLNKGGYEAEQSGIHAPNTLRQLTQNTTQLNGIYNSQLNKGGYEAEQSGVHVPNTLRQLTQNVTQINGIYNSQLNKGGYEAEQSGVHVPNTLRQLTQNVTQINGIYNSQINKGGYQAEQSGTIAKPTLRQLTQNTTQINGIYNSQINKGGYQAEQSGTIAKPTLRQLTQHNTTIQPAYRHEATQTRTRSDYNAALMNIARENANIVRDGGKPTDCNYEVIPTYEQMTVELKDPIQVNRDVYGTQYGQNPLQCIPQMHTRFGKGLPEQDFRLDPCVLSGLQTNPFINNVMFKAVEY